MRYLLPLLLTGCLSADGFDEEHAQSYCTLLTECESLDLYGYPSQDACLAEVEPTADGCTSFDKEAGQDCLDRIGRMSCTALNDDRFPNACEQVCGTEE